MEAVRSLQLPRLNYGTVSTYIPTYVDSKQIRELNQPVI